MKRILILIWLTASTSASAQQRQFYDSAGRNAGRAVTDTQGTTTFYDAAGRKAGSVTQSTQPKGKSKMRMMLYSDNGAPCFKCGGTIHAYHCDDAVSLIDTVCISCRARNVISVTKTPTTPAEVSAAHRSAIR
jgi:hypothetical protein